jgi:type II secretory pathway pseudopilin PulG
MDLYEQIHGVQMDEQRGLMKHKKNFENYAFSILEVMSAIAVMAMGLGVAIHGLQIGLRNLDVARTTTAVAQVMQSEAERIRLLTWEMVTQLPASQNLTLDSVFATRALKNGSVTVTRYVDDVAGFSNMKMVKLQATWRSIDGVSHDRRFQFRYTQGGLYDYYRS